MASRGPPLLGAREPDSAVSSSPYPIIGNRKSHIYHRPDCPNYIQVAPHHNEKCCAPLKLWTGGLVRAIILFLTPMPKTP